MTSQLTRIIKESSFDCGIYPHGKEKFTCMSFPSATASKFTYVPDYSKQEKDTTVQINKRQIEWIGTAITINGKKYVARTITKDKLYKIYDLESYKEALKNPGVNPIQVGTFERDKYGDGNDVFIAV